MSPSIDSTQTPSDSARNALVADTEHALVALNRLQGEFERSMADPDVIQEDRSSAQLLAEQARQTLHNAQAALVRFDAGTYGICIECGASIAADRIEALPDAKTCRQCS